jgi:hypothetical protein
LSRSKRAAGIYQKAISDRLPTQEQSKPHFVSVGKGQFNIPFPIEQANSHVYDGTQFFVSVGTAHPPFSQEFGLRGYLLSAAALQGVYLETNHAFPSALERLHIKCVEGRRSGTRIDFCFYGTDTKIRQTDKLAPPDNPYGLFYWHFTSCLSMRWYQNEPPEIYHQQGNSQGM